MISSRNYSFGTGVDQAEAAIFSMGCCIVFLISCLLMASPAGAKESRGCHGVIYALPSEITNSEGEVRFGPGAHSAYAEHYQLPEEQMVLIDGNGYCKKGQENKKCRKVAADAALKCAREIWNKRLDRVVPNSKCGNNTNAQIREWAPAEDSSTQTNLYGDIKTTIEYKTCCAQEPTAKFVKSIVGYTSFSSHDLSFTRGQSRRNDRAQEACGRRDLLSTGYGTDCERLKSEGTIQCPKPPIPDSKPPSAEQRSNGGAKPGNRVTATTSKNTSTTSASHSDIKKALDKKNNKQGKDSDNRVVRTNPADPKAAVNNKLRYRALMAEGGRQQQISDPRLLVDFLDFGAQMAFDKNMRLVDFEVAMVNRHHYYVGLWEKGQGTSILTKPLAIADFNELHEKNLKKGLRLADFELTRKRGKTYVASLWRSGSAGEQFSPSMSASAFKQRNALLKQQNMYPVDIEARLDGGEIRYAALWREVEPGVPVQLSAGASGIPLLAAQTGFMQAVKADQFKSYRDELESKGKQAVDIERLVIDGAVYFAGLWADGNSSSRVSKPRGLNKFKKFVGSDGASVVSDLEIHIRRD